MAGNDDDDMDFELNLPGPDPDKSHDTIPDTDEYDVRAIRGLQSLETGATAVSLDADPNRKIVRHPNTNAVVTTPDTGETFTSPNEDAFAANTIAIDANTDPTAQLLRVMSHVDGRHRTRDDGSTVSSALIVGDKLYTANMGDSPVLVITYDPTVDAKAGTPFTVTQVTRDHVASDSEERNKLPNPAAAKENRKGRWGVYADDNSVAAMITRSIGDRRLKLNHEPELQSVDLSPDIQAGKQVFVIAGSDGIMEKTNVANIETMFNQLARHASSWDTHPPTADEIAYQLTGEIYNAANQSVDPYRRNDDTTVVVQPVTPAMASGSPKPDGKQDAVLITVADGHGYAYEQTLDNEVVLGADNKPIPLYDRPLSQQVVEEMQRYMQSPHLMQERKRALP